MKSPDPMAHPVDSFFSGSREFRAITTWCDRVDESGGDSIGGQGARGIVIVSGFAGVSMIFCDCRYRAKKPASYCFGLFRWCPGAESNHRHEDFQSTALPLSYPGMGERLARSGHGVLKTGNWAVQMIRTSRSGNVPFAFRARRRHGSHVPMSRGQPATGAGFGFRCRDLRFPVPPEIPCVK